MKINNAMFIVILAALYIAFNYKSLRVKSVLIGVAAFILPIAVYALNVYLQTGNPVFPFYNNVFKSEFFELGSGLDARWGPESVLQGLIWPIYGMFDTTRTSGPTPCSGAYSSATCSTMAPRAATGARITG